MQKSSEEHLDRERERAWRVRPSVRVLKGDLALAEACEALIGERDAIDIAREIQRRVPSVTNWLNMDGPAPVPHARVDSRDNTGAGQRVVHLRSEEAGEDIAGEQKPGMGRPNPRRAIWGEPTGAHQQMHMRMIVERPRPGVEHGQDGGRPADPRAIVGHHLHGARRFAEEHTVHQALMILGHGAQLRGQRKGEQIVIAGEQALRDVREPPLRPIGLTLGAMSIATGVIPVVKRAARVAAIERATESGRAAANDVLEGLSLRRQEPAGVPPKVRRSCGAKNVRQFEHERRERARYVLGINSLMGSVAASRSSRVTCV